MNFNRQLVVSIMCLALLGACIKKVKTELPPVKIEVNQVSMSIAGRRVTAEPCSIDSTSPLMKHRWFNQAIRALKVLPDGKVLILDHESKLRRYRSQSAEECELAVDRSFGNHGVIELSKKGRYDTISYDSWGNIYLSGFIVKPLKIMRKKATQQCDKPGRILIDPETNRATQRRKLISLEDNCEPKEVHLDKWTSLRKLNLLKPWKQGYIAAGRKNKLQTLAIHRQNGSTEMMVGDETGDERICNVKTVEPCRFGWCLVDSNCRALRIWKTDGTFVGKISFYKFLGLDYPWVNGLSVGKNVSYLAVSHKGISRKKVSYGIVYRIKGL